MEIVLYTDVRHIVKSHKSNQGVRTTIQAPSEVIHDGHRAVSVANLVEVLFLRKAIAGRYVQMFVGGDRADQV